MTKASANPKRVSALQKRFNKQVDGLIEALSKRSDVSAPWSCIYNACLDTADLDTPQNGNRTPVKKLIGEAIAKAKHRETFTTEWDWKASPNEVLVELNRVLEPLGITVQSPEPADCDGDSVVFEFVRCPNNPVNAVGAK